jgi:phage terminase large subunit-like protein
MTSQTQDDSSAESNDPVTQYALDVTEGRVIAGPHVRAACRRHLKDLEEAPQRGFFFDREKVDWVLSFFREVLCLNGGEFEGVPYEPLPWQCFIIGSLFGWVNEKGYRRFRVSFVETSKGSGKSPLAAGIGMYGLVADEEARAEIYAAASKKDQAMVLFRDAVAMRDLSPELSPRLEKSGVGERTWNLAHLDSGSFFRPISADDGQSGPRPHIALLDEIHEHKDNMVVEMMRAGTKGRRQALIFMITNSGHDRQSVCWEYHDYAIKVAEGQIEDDSFFSYVCALDEGDDPLNDESCWPKTNPSLGVTIQLDYLREQVTQAKGMPSKESIVLRLNFSKWVGSSSPWISADVWFAAQEQYDASYLAGRRCHGGLDLSSTTDLTSLVLLFEPTADDPNWRLLPYFWLPEEGLRKKGERDGVDYLRWVEDGWLETTPGRSIKKTFIARRLRDITSEFELISLAYDRWRFKDLEAILEDEGIELPLKEFGQGYKDMGPAVEKLEARLLENAPNGDESVSDAALGETDFPMKHNGSPPLTWCAANVVMLADPSGARKPAKNKSTGRIDGIVAAVMAAGVSGEVGEFVIDENYELLVA